MIHWLPLVVIVVIGVVAVVITILRPAMLTTEGWL